MFSARDTQLDVTVAVKLLHIADPELRAQLSTRLSAEGAILSRLAHPYVLRVFEHGRDGDDHYIVTELADGGTLADQLEREGPLPPRLAARFVLQALAALQAAHDAGVIHRDVKPGNLLLVHGDVRLADFGIALGSDEERHTKTGIAMGSWAFMAPEQRVDAKSVRATADVYAAGCTLYNLITGATATDLFLAERTSPRWSDIPNELVPILRRATQGKPEARYASASDMAAALAPLLDTLQTRPVAARKPDPEGTPMILTSASASPASVTMPVIDLTRPPLPPEEPIRTRYTAVWLGAVLVLFVSVAVPLLIPSLTESIKPISTVPEPATPEALSPMPAPMGAWRGRLGPHQTYVVFVEQDGTVHADVTVALGSNEAVHTASGQWDPAKRTLALADEGTFPLAADWTCTLTESNVTLEGEGVIRATGEHFSVMLLYEGE